MNGVREMLVLDTLPLVDGTSHNAVLAIHYVVNEASCKNVRTSTAYSSTSHDLVERVQQTFGDQVILQMSKLSFNSWVYILDDVVALSKIFNWISRCKFIRVGVWEYTFFRVTANCGWCRTTTTKQVN